MPKKKYNTSTKTTASNRDNLIRGINTTLKQYFDVFGGQSKEYIEKYKEARDIIKGGKGTFSKGYDFQGDAPTEPLQLSRGQASQASDQQLKDLRNVQLNGFTANQKAIAYNTVLTGNVKKRLTPQEKQSVKQAAQTIYYVYNNSVEIYNELIDTEYSSEISRLMSEFNSTMNTSEKHDLANQILDLYNKHMEEQNIYESEYDDSYVYDLEDYET